MKPNFLCVGFPKCGTTSLQEILKQHKDIYLPEVKEAGYFIDSLEYTKGIKWYLKRYFSDVKNEKIIGEINGGLTGGFYARNIRKDLSKDLKIIFIMRNPVDRLYSHFKYKLKVGRSLNHIDIYTKLSDTKAFDLFVNDNIKYSNKFKVWNTVTSGATYFIEQGKYSEYICEYLKYFPKENLKFIIFEEYIKNPEEIYKDLFKFLNISYIKEINYHKKANEGNKEPRNEVCFRMNEFVTDIWQWYLRSAKFSNNKTDKIILNIRDFLWNIFNKTKIDKNDMSSDSRIKLEDYYRKDKEILKKLLQKDLDNIWYK